MLLTPMGVGDAPTMEAVDAVARRWWVPLLTGILTVAAGVVILEVEWTASSLAWVVGAVFIYRGITHALNPSFSAAARAVNAVTSILSVLAGVAFVLWPDPTLLVLAIFIGAYLVVDGIMHMAGAVELRHDLGSWWIELGLGAVITAIGFLALRRPDATLAGLVMFAGLWAIVVGIAEIMAAFVVRSAPRELRRLGAGAAAGADGTIVLGQVALTTDQQLIMLDQLHRSGSLTDDEVMQAAGRLRATAPPPAQPV